MNHPYRSCRLIQTYDSNKWKSPERKPSILCLAMSNRHKKKHGFSHLGIWATRKFIPQGYFWPNMSHYIGEWSRAYTPCQRSTIHKQTFIRRGALPPADNYEHIHLDTTRPFTCVRGKSFCLTMIDRYTCWAEAIAVEETLAETIARSFYDDWIVRFSPPHPSTTDQGV